MGFPLSSVGKQSACNAGVLGLIPGSGRSHGDGNGKSLKYSCQDNPTDRGAWQATVHGVARVGHDLAIKPPPPYSFRKFPGSSVHKESDWSSGHPDFISGSGRYPGEGNGNSLQYSWLENAMDRGTRWAAVHGVARVRHDLVTKPQPDVYWTSDPQNCKIIKLF